MAKFSKSIIWDKAPEETGPILIFGDILISLKYSVVEGNLHAKKTARSVQPVRYNTGVWQRDRRTDRHRPRAYISLAERRAQKHACFITVIIAQCITLLYCNLKKIFAFVLLFLDLFLLSHVCLVCVNKYLLTYFRAVCLYSHCVRGTLSQGSRSCPH